MNALIFAAGRGERMQPLSDTTAKPLLMAGGRRLIEWQIAALVRAGVTRIVINTAHLAAQIEDTLGDGGRYGAQLVYSREGERAEDALETLGGLVHARALLGAEPLIVVSGDIVTDFDYARLLARVAPLARGELDAHLVLVDNPPFHPCGDMGLDAAAGRITRGAPWLTYASIALLAPRLWADEAPGRKKLFPWLYAAVERGRVSGEHFRGRWYNVGTPQELAAADAALRAAAPAWAS